MSLSELQTEEEKIINENKKRIFNEKQQNSFKQAKLENGKRFIYIYIIIVIY